MEILILLCILFPKFMAMIGLCLLGEVLKQMFILILVLLVVILGVILITNSVKMIKKRV